MTPAHCRFIYPYPKFKVPLKNPKCTQPLKKLKKIHDRVRNGDNGVWARGAEGIRVNPGGPATAWVRETLQMIFYPTILPALPPGWLRTGPVSSPHPPARSRIPQQSPYRSCLILPLARGAAATPGLARTPWASRRVRCAPLSLCFPIPPGFI